MCCVYLGKLVIRPSQPKNDKELPKFPNKIQGDICGHIHTLCGSFYYFMVMIDSLNR